MNLPPRTRQARSASPNATPAREGPRERLEHLGAASLSDAELVALLLRTGGRACAAEPLAGALLGRHGGLAGLARAAPAELRATSGVGAAKSASLLAALELGRRLATRRLRPGDAVRSPADVHRHFHARLRDASQEGFWVLLLDGRHRVRREAQISLGTLTASLVHPREVFRPALREAAAALILVHNHPSGDPTPSPEDREVTARLVRAGELLGVPVLDHVVIAEGGYVSLREAGGLLAADEAPGAAAGSSRRGPAPAGRQR